MTYHGHVKNGVIVLDEPVDFEDGTPVRVEVVGSGEKRVPTLAERLSDVIGSIDGLPEDLSVNHDRYLLNPP